MSVAPALNSAGTRYPAIGPAWRRAREHVVPLFAFPPAIRKMIYGTDAAESLHRSWRQIIKTRGSFPTDEAARKLLFPAIRNAGLCWPRPIEGTAAVGQSAILFRDRFEPAARQGLKTMRRSPSSTAFQMFPSTPQSLILLQKTGLVNDRHGIVIRQVLDNMLAPDVTQSLGIPAAPPKDRPLPGAGVTARIRPVLRRSSPGTHPETDPPTRPPVPA